MHSTHLAKTAQNDWREVVSPSSCNALAPVTILSGQWNKLPLNMRSTDTREQFKRSLNGWLFKCAYGRQQEYFGCRDTARAPECTLGHLQKVCVPSSFI